MNAAAPQQFTAAQIARALGKQRQAVQHLLRDVAPSGTKIVTGNAASAWSISALPQAVQLELAAGAAREHCGSVDEFVVNSPAPVWEPPIPIEKLHPSHREKATKLRDVMDTTLIRSEDITVPESELCAIGAADFKRVFGYAISTRHFRRILDRTLQRDGNAHNWSRLAIYLDDSAFSLSAPDPAAARIQYLHRALDETIKHLENKNAPTSDDRAYLFDAAFHHYEKLTREHDEKPADKDERKRIKRSLVLYLRSALPVLSKSESALRRLFELKLNIWIEGGRTPQSLMDKRPLGSGNFRKPDFAADLKKIQDEAIRLGGNESLAHRQLRKRHELSPEFCAHYDFNIRKNKSYVPKSIRAELTPQVNMTGPLFQGPWKAREEGPYIPRDWSDTRPGDYFSGDDVTWNHYFYFYDDDGKLQIERGECLLLTDLRTGYPLDFLLIAGKYNSRHIRSLILSVHDKLGLPHIGTYLENGVWRARMISGEKQKHFIHWRETQHGFSNLGLGLGNHQELGLGEIGLATRNTTIHRAKPIEGMFHILQDVQRRERGFIGNNERLNGQERMLEFIGRCRSGKELPESELLSMQDWRDRIRAGLEEYMHEPQNGKMLPGVSPFEMWAPAMDQKPLRKLKPEDRYMLATHKKVVRVRQEGIVLNIGKDRALYCNEETGKLIGRDVLAFYNVDRPDILTCSDLNRQNYFSVKRILLPAMTATREQFAAAHAQINGHKKAAKTIFGKMEHSYSVTVARDNGTTEESKELGRFHNAEVEKSKEAKSAATRTLRKIQLKAAAEGIAVSSNVRNPDRVLAGIDRAKEYRDRIARKEQSTEGQTAHE